MKNSFFRFPLLVGLYLLALTFTTSLYFNPLTLSHLNQRISHGPWVGMTQGFLFLLLLVNIVFLMIFLRGRHPFYPKVTFITLGLVISLYHFVALLSPLPQMEGTPIVVRGEVKSGPKDLGDKVQYTFKVKAIKLEDKWQEIKGTTLLRIEQGSPWRYNDLLEVRGIIIEPRQALNPGEFCYKSYLAREGIFTILNGQGPPKKLGEVFFPSLKGLALDLQRKLVEFNTQTLSPDGRDLMNSMTLGYTQDLDRDLREDMARLGIAHLLAVSGFHVAVVAALPLLIASKLGWSPKRTFAITAIVVVIYALVTGGKAPVMRATLMILAPLLGKIINRKSHWVHNLLGAVLILTLIKPSLILEGGFQLSVGATAGILALIKPLREGLSFLPKGLVLPLVVPLAAQIATLPIIAYHFNEIPTLGIIANLLIVDLATVIIYFGLGAAVLSLISYSLGHFVNLVTDFWVEVFIWLIDKSQGLPGLTINIAPPTWSLIIAFYGLLTLWAWPRLRYIFFLKARGFLYPLPPKFKNRIFLLVGGAFAIWLLTLSSKPMEITFLAVGQGDSAVISTSKGQTIIIDTGPRIDDNGGYSFDAGKEIIIPFLKYKGINEVDLILITHPHYDHYGGTLEIGQRIKVKQIGLLKGQEGIEPYHSIRELNKNQRIPILQLSAGDEILLDRDTRLDVLHPRPWTKSQGEEDFNNNSLVVQLEHKDKRILFAGDIEGDPMENMARTYGTRLASEILKVPHHGSKGSIVESFYERVKPQVAIIPVGENYYGHPHQETLRFLDSLGIKTYRTDIHGAIHIQLGSQIVLKPFNQQ